MCIRDRLMERARDLERNSDIVESAIGAISRNAIGANGIIPVSYTHLRAHETVLDLVCRLLLEKKKQKINESGRRLTMHI